MFLKVCARGKATLINFDHVVEVRPDPSDPSPKPRALLFFLEGRGIAGDIVPVKETYETICDILSN